MTSRVEVIRITCYGGTARGGREKHDPTQIITFTRDGDVWRETTGVPELDPIGYGVSEMRCPVCSIDAPANDYAAVLRSVLDDFAASPDGPVTLHVAEGVIDVPLLAVAAALGRR